MKKNDKIILIFFQKLKRLRWKFEKPEISYILEQTVPYIICSKCKNEDENIFKEEESFEILKLLDLIENM